MNLPVCMLNPIPLSIHTATLLWDLGSFLLYSTPCNNTENDISESHQQDAKDGETFLILTAWSKWGVHTGREGILAYEGISHPSNINTWPPYRFVDRFFTKFGPLHSFGVFRASSMTSCTRICIRERKVGSIRDAGLDAGKLASHACILACFVCR
jgi:hypothetical protein